MEVIFEVREKDGGGFVARAPGHSIVAEAATWEELRNRAREAANSHFAQAQKHPDLIRLHLVRDDVIQAATGDPVPSLKGETWIRDLEPALSTPPELLDVLSDLSSREPIFHRPESGTTRTDFEKMTVEDYWETGASGRRYSRQAVLNELERRFSVPHEDAWETSDFHCLKLAANVYLLTYTLLQDQQRLTRRATIWQRTPEGWKIVYHQGTIVQDA